MLFLAVLLFAIIPPATSQFFSPTQSRELWRVGETKKIQYNTKFTQYTIALWQQALAGGSANLGPVIFQTDAGPLKELEWEVQTYQLDLASSNVFFLWLFEGGPSVQGNQSVPQMSSAFFNITDQPAPSSSVDSTPSTTLETSTTTLFASSTTSVEPDRTQTTSVGGNSAGSNPTAQSSESSSPNPGSSGVLSVGAQAGIGIGAGLAGITCIVCGVIWCRYVRKQQKALKEWQGMVLSQRDPPSYHAWGPVNESARQPPPEPKNHYRSSEPVEIG